MFPKTIEVETQSGYVATIPLADIGEDAGNYVIFHHTNGRTTTIRKSAIIRITTV